MLLYNLSFPCEEICNEQELYFRGGELRDGGVFVKSGKTVSFDTYFNCFSHIKYKKYTRLKSVTLRLAVEGKGVISICRYVGKSDEATVVKSSKKPCKPHVDTASNECEYVKLAEQYISGECAISVDIADIPDKGFIYFVFEADGDAFIRSGGWYSDIDGRDVKIGIVICTYKREKFVKRNIANLTSYMNMLGKERFFDVFVVDNGRTLENDFGEGITVIPNENSGGSGGFTRGMKEVCAKDYTHFLLMDDDILFDVNILQRTYSLLSVLKYAYRDASVGGAMLVLDKPYVQLEMGADWNGIKIFSHRKRVDVRKAKEICLNEEDVEADYNGWFYTCMPVSAPTKFGYPLPFFIKCDDIEYGLRATEHIISSSGIAVWHEDFDIKYVPGIEYYINRNELILNSRFPKGKGAFAQWLKLAKRVGQQLVLQRYYSVDLIFKAYADFLKGPQYIFGFNGEECYSAIRKNCPKFLTESEIKDEYDIALDYKKIDEKMLKKRGLCFKHILTLNGYLIPKCFYKKGIAQINMVNFNMDGLYMKRKVLQFNPITGKGFVTEIKKSELWKSGFKLAGYFFKMMFCYRHISKKYAKINID